MQSTLKNKSHKEPPIEIKITLDSFMPSPSILYNYYEILKELGFISYKISKKPIKTENIQSKHHINSELSI